MKEGSNRSKDDRGMSYESEPYIRAPLSPPVDEELYENQDKYVASKHEKEKTDNWHHLPLALVLIPPLGAVIHGRAENWTDGIILILVCFYLYQLIKVPWDIYYASHARYVLKGTTSNSGDTKERRHAAQILRRVELFSLFTTVLVPAIGSGLLFFVRNVLSDPDRYINGFTISLFALATSVKPFLHVSKLIKNTSLYYQEAVWYPSTEVHLLRRRVENLEKDISNLTRAFATKDDVRNLRDGVDIPLSQLSKAVRKFDKKEEYLRLSSEEKFALLDFKLDKAAQELAANSTSIQILRQEQDTATHPLATILKVIKHVLIGHSQSSLQPQHTLNWTQKGLLWYIFLPLNVSNSALGWISSSSKSLSLGIGHLAEGESTNSNSKRFRDSKAGKRIAVA